MRIFNQVVLDEFLVDTIGGTVHFTDARWSALLGTADSLVFTVVADSVVLGGGSSGSIRVFAYHSGDARFFPAGAVPASALPPQLIGKTRSPGVSLGAVDATTTWVAVGTASQKVPSGAYLTLGVKVTAPVGGTISTHVRVIVTGRIRGWVKTGRSGAKPQTLPSRLASSCEESVVSRRFGQTSLARRGLPPAKGAVSAGGATVAAGQSTLPARAPTRPRQADAGGESGSPPESAEPPGRDDERSAWERTGLRSLASRTLATPASPPSEDIQPHPFRVTTEPVIPHEDPRTEPHAVASMVPSAEPIHDDIGRWWRRGLRSRAPVHEEEAPAWWRLGLQETRVGPALGVDPTGLPPPPDPPHAPGDAPPLPSNLHVSVKLGFDVKGPDGSTWILAGHGAAGSDKANIYGTDLGFSVRLPGAKPGGPNTLIFFGDTWLNADPARDRPSPAPPPGNNDALGRATAPSGKHETPSVEFVSSSETLEFAAISIPGVALGNFATPVAAFTTSSGETYVAVNGDATGTLLARWAKSGASFSLVPTAKSFRRVLGFPLPGIPPLPLDLFALPAIAAVPAAQVGPGSPFNMFQGDAVFVWGRAFIQAERYNSQPIPGVLDVYLFVFDSWELEHGPVKYWYFSGFDDAQAPTWNPAPNDAELVPVVSTDDGSEVWVVGQTTATFDADLGLWLLLYGGHVTPPLEGTANGFSSPPPYETKLGVHLRYALNPWGPWSAPLRIWPDVAGGTLANLTSRCKLIFLPEAFVLRYGALPLPPHKYGGDFTSSPGQPVSLGATLGHAPGLPDCVWPDDLTSGGGRYLHGAEYGTAIWQGAGEVLSSDPQRVVKSMYFAMSTYNPYHVILMKTEITKMLIQGQ